jgi:hypothetical protein
MLLTQHSEFALKGDFRSRRLCSEYAGYFEGYRNVGDNPLPTGNRAVSNLKCRDRELELGYLEWSEAG